VISRGWNSRTAPRSPFLEPCHPLLFKASSQKTRLPPLHCRSGEGPPWLRQATRLDLQSARTTFVLSTSGSAVANKHAGIDPRAENRARPRPAACRRRARPEAEARGLAPPFSSLVGRLGNRSEAKANRIWPEGYQSDRVSYPEVQRDRKLTSLTGFGPRQASSPEMITQS
jgi:hypothetical protein